MKKKLLVIFLCCALVFGLVPSVLSTAFSNGSEFSVYSSNGEATDKITLPQNDKATLTAVAKGVSGSYQWQIRISDSVWANIVGSTKSTLELSYAMVANLLKGDSVDIRCRLTNGVNNVTYTNIVEVTVEKEIPAASANNEPEFGSVVSGAEPIGEAVVFSAPVLMAQSAAQDDNLTEDENEIGADSLSEEEPFADGESGVSNDAPASPSTYSIVINYVFASGTQAAPSWTATVAVGTTYSQKIKSPVVLGYKADREIVEVNASGEITYTVTYSADSVNYTVKHWQQNVQNDEYTLSETETKDGYTESEVGENLEKKYDGFYSLLYDTTTKVAADGSTEVNIYYDRYYYLMSFNLDGGFGVEPIYARYGAPISVGTPQKPGFTFSGWNETIPTTMPSESGSYTARWEAGESGFTVVFWYENADDNGYSVAGTYTPANVAPGTQKNSDDYKDQNFDGRDTEHFTYNDKKTENVTVSGDGSTVLNVYYTRNTYTLTFTDGQQTLTCTKTEHVHSNECCKNGGTGVTHWRHQDSCCKLGLKAHTHNENCYITSDLTITAKYGADIHGNFPISDSDGETILWNVPKGCKSFKPGTYLASINTMPGENIEFSVYEHVSEATIWYYVEAPAGETTGTRTYNGKKFILYKSVKYTKSGTLTYAEEFHDIIGFKQWASDPKFSSFDQNGTTDTIKNDNYLYYTRNSYNLKFYNYNDYVSGKGGSVQYEAPLNDYYFEPQYPSDLEPNAYVFAGWYTTAGCYEGSEANLAEMSMPASDVILYAKWTPKTHTVKTYLTKSDMESDKDVIYTWDNVSHGDVIESKPKDPTNGKYTFVGWFYISDTGEEKAFNFSMPVNRDLNLYAKWSSNTLMPYTVYYKLDDGTEIAPPTTGSALAGSTKTFDAKTGAQLNEGYQSGYFPTTASHSLTIDIEGKNVFTFVYVPKEEVNYTVRYLEKDTNAVLHEEKHASTRNAVITEQFEQISGYAPDAYQKRLVLSADEENNVITFLYVKDDVHAPVQIIHYTQNIAGEDYTEYQSSTNLNGIIGDDYSESPLKIPGFTYNEGKSTASGTLGREGLVLELYYDRIEYPYEFRFLEQGTTKELADSEKDTARYMAQVTQNAKTIPGYKLVAGAAESQAITIAIEDPADVANKNVKTFYYVEETVDIKYETIGPDGCGKLDNYQDNGIGVLSGDSLKGSAPTAAEGFKFVGWFKDKGCTVAVDSAWVTEGNKLTPQRTKNYGTQEKEALGYEAATYYAKFEYDLADLTITKQGCVDIDENQSFIFEVSGPDGYSTKVVIQGNNSVTVKGLKIGKYTVKELTEWSWRYETDTPSQDITLRPAEENKVTFQNSRTYTKWLGGDDYNQNIFDKIDN